MDEKILDEEQSKYLECNQFKCPCGSDIFLYAEIVSKTDPIKVIQYLVKCSNNKSPLNVFCARTGMIWKNELIYNWD